VNLDIADVLMMVMPAFAAGVVLGLLAFGGLWLTVRRLPRSRRPGLLLLGSFVARLGVSVPVILVVMGGRWERLAACFAGFLLARTVLIRLWSPASAPARTG